MRWVFFLTVVLTSVASRLRRVLPGGALPLTPTAAQLQWQRDEIMALVHFNMATFFRNGDPGCDASNWNARPGSSEPSSFAPTNLNASNWAESMLALGVTEAVLTAKHGCGFYTWPTKVTLPNGAPYGYNVSPMLNVLQKFTDAMNSAGLGHGFYYSLTNNFYLNVFGHYVRNSTLLPGQVLVTQAEFEAIALASVTELWTDFGNLTEIWFDGGYTTDMQQSIKALLAELQPTALALNGAGISPSCGRWSRTEGDIPPGWPNVYSTTCCSLTGGENIGEDPCDGPGCPPDQAAAFYNPSSTDYTLQASDIWFYEPGAPLRPLAELQLTYHATVGANTVMELDFAIDRTGNVAPNHATLYRAFGDWRRACYGSPLARARLMPGEISLTLSLGDGPVGLLMDRVVLQEALAVDKYGQCVANYTLEVEVDGVFKQFGVSGAATIGNKRIELGGALPGVGVAAFNATAVRFNVTKSFCVPDVTVSAFSPVPCLPPPTPHSRVHFRYGGLCLVTNTTFPCGSGAKNSCPIFLGDCTLPEASWDDGDGVSLTNLGVVSQPNVVNVDCDSCAVGSLAKLITGSGSAASLTFSAAAGGQLSYACNNLPEGLCLNGGQGTAIPPCGGESFLAVQIKVAPCSSGDASGWVREAAE